MGGALVLILGWAGCTSANDAPTIRAAENPPIVLRADGLGVVKFGERAALVERALTRRFGKPTSTVKKHPKGCDDESSRIVTFADALTAYFADAKFSGWVYFTDEPRLRTSEGATLGMSFDRMHEIYGDRMQVLASVGGSRRTFVIDGPLPTGIAGLASSRGGTTTLGAGSHCGHLP